MIPFLDLKKINAPFEAEIKKVLTETVDSGWYVLGKRCEVFEQSFAEFCEAKHCIGLANGLDAITLMLRAYDFPPQSEIIVPANTYIATILGILNAGHIPVFVEPNIQTYLLDESHVETKITPKTRAILFVELYGKTGNLKTLKEIAQKHHLKLVSDSAQSHGVTFEGKPTSYWFDSMAYSFYPTKNLGAMGDAGCVITNDDSLAKTLKYLRNYGSFVKYEFDFQGINSRLDELQASILSVKLPFLLKEVNVRRRIARRYLSEITNKSINLPAKLTMNEDAWHLFVIRCQQRDKLKQFLLEKGIGTDVHYPKSPHKQAALAQFNDYSFPITEQIHREVLSIPLNGTLTEKEISYIIDTLNSFSFD